jgi:hypothetical protein
MAAKVVAEGKGITGIKAADFVMELFNFVDTETFGNPLTKFGFV